MDRSTMALFAGNANPQLAQDIARHLMVPLGRSSVGRFSDGETTVELLENVRGRDVGSFVQEARTALAAKVPLPAGSYLEWSGQYENERRARERR